jgi:hypothetical protein
MTENRKKKMRIDSQNIAEHSLLNHKNAVKREAAQFVFDEYLKRCQNKKDNRNMHSNIRKKK